ncbi:MAG: hypothetical protein MZV70_50550 [Desulfobacterales bacterium]|nr:hypothetical protein [Desulfobacterales bacterium]
MRSAGGRLARRRGGVGDAEWPILAGVDAGHGRPNVAIHPWGARRFWTPKTGRSFFKAPRWIDRG